MNFGKFLLLGATAAVLAGCAALDPSLSKEERAVLDFNVNGVKIGSPQGALAIFPQVQHIPIKLGGYDVWEVFNVSANISEMKAWYFDNRLVRLELRYFNGPGVSTLSRAGGWDGIRNYLMQKYGPPSRFGSDVPIVATKGQWNVKYAKFNGEWIFSRIKRQINYSAMADKGEGIAVVTVMDTTPILVPKTAAAPERTTVKVTRVETTPEEVAPPAPNPGF
jgi:hypothetical protein